jgi:hypothetical protein
MPDADMPDVRMPAPDVQASDRQGPDVQAPAMHVLVTGGAGYIGTHTLIAMLAAAKP